MWSRIGNAVKIIIMVLVLGVLCWSAYYYGQTDSTGSYEAIAASLYMDGEWCKIGSPVLASVDDVAILEACFDEQVPPGAKLNYHGHTYVSINRMPDYGYTRDMLDAVYVYHKDKSFDNAWTQNVTYIAHALGGIDGFDYLNCKEALELNYAHGCRCFEVDVSLTSDGKLAVIHDWSRAEYEKLFGHSFEEGNEKPMSLEEFLNTRIMDQYTTLSWEDMLGILEAHEDIMLVLDTKNNQPGEIEQVYGYICDSTANMDNQKALMDRIVPQFYSEETFAIISGLYPWKSVIYTMYEIPEEEFSEDRVIDFVTKNGVSVVTTYKGRDRKAFVEQLQKRGVAIYMHTYNNPKKVDWLLKERRITGVYTDFLFLD